MSVKQTADSNDQAACSGTEKIRYQFGERVMDESSVSMTQDSLKLSEFDKKIVLPQTNPYADYS